MPVQVKTYVPNREQKKKKDKDKDKDHVGILYS